MFTLAIFQRDKHGILRYRWWCPLFSVCPAALCLSVTAAQCAGQKQHSAQERPQSADTRVSDSQMPKSLWKNILFFFWLKCMFIQLYASCTYICQCEWIYLCLYVLPVRRHEKFYCTETDFQRSISLQLLIHPWKRHVLTSTSNLTTHCLKTMGNKQLYLTCCDSLIQGPWTQKYPDLQVESRGAHAYLSNCRVWATAAYCHWNNSNFRVH